MCTFFRSTFRALGLVLLVMGLRTAPLFAQNATASEICNQPLPRGGFITYLNLGKHPRFVLPSWDGCWIFVTAHDPELKHPQFPRGLPGVAVVKRTGGTLAQVRFVVMPEYMGTPERAWNMNLTRDQKVLIVGGNRQIAFFDVDKLTSGADDPVLGTISDPHFSDVGVGMALTADDRYLLVPQRATHWLSIINLEKARSQGFNPAAIEGGVPTGAAGMVLLSTDERRLYLMNTSAPPAMKWPELCGDNQQPQADKVSEGLLQVIDFERARSNPKSAVIASVSLGCNPSRIVLSPDGDTLYVTGGPVQVGTGTRIEALSSFDTRPVAAGLPPKLLGTVTLGERKTSTAIGLALIENGRKAAVAHSVDSNFGLIALVDTSKILAGREAVVGAINADKDLSNLAVTADGRFLLSAALDDKTLQAIDLQQLPRFQQPAEKVFANYSDSKAYDEAAALTEPQKRVAALEKFIEDFPQSRKVYDAHWESLQTLVKNMPDQKARILGHAEQVESDDLIEAGLLLDKAEEMKARDLAEAEAKSAMEKRELQATTDAFMGTLYLKQGKLEEAEKALRSAYDAILDRVRPRTFARPAALGLADIAEKRGDDTRALEYLSVAAVLGEADVSIRQRLERLYRKNHQNSVSGLDASLDTVYKRLFPNPIKTVPYQTVSQSNRTVLVEVLTGEWMRPAAAWDGQSAATHATEAILQRYPRADVSLLVYPQPSVVVPNALINSASQVRASYYNAGYQPQEPDIIRDRNSSPPRFVVDGVDINVPDRNRPNRIATSEGLFDEVKRALEKELGKPSGVELRLRAEMTGPEVRATAHVQGLNAGNTHYKLHIALVEQWVRHSFQIDREVIRVHSMVVRSLAGNDGKGLSLEPVTASRSWTFNLDSISRDIEKYLSDFENAERMINPAFGFGEKPPAMDPSNLAIVAFIQDDDSKEVLQSISVKVQGGDGPQVESR